MKIFRTKFSFSILAFLLFLGIGYYYRGDISRLFKKILNQSQPCQKPITYSISIANLDPRFGLTKTEALNYIQQAEKILEVPINKQLFEYSPTGDLKINFIYDYRQKATDTMKKIGIVINDDRSTYELLKAKYDSFVILYNKQKAQLTTLIATYNADQIAYNKDINLLNGRGGASKAEYKILEQKRVNLNNQVTTINQAADALNKLADTINSAKVVMNKLITALNLQVNKYNTTNSSTGEAFSEGEYIRDTGGTAINIYQFDNTDQLVRILVHELGHAIGLEHLDNPKAIMYYLNDGINDKLTADDLAALKNVCGIK